MFGASARPLRGSSSPASLKGWMCAASTIDSPVGSSTRSPVAAQRQSLGQGHYCGAFGDATLEIASRQGHCASSSGSLRVSTASAGPHRSLLDSPLPPLSSPCASRRQVAFGGSVRHLLRIQPAELSQSASAQRWRRFGIAGLQHRAADGLQDFRTVGGQVKKSACRDSTLSCDRHLEPVP